MKTVKFDLSRVMVEEYGWFRNNRIGQHGVPRSRQSQRQMDLYNLAELLHENSKFARYKNRDVGMATTLFQDPLMVEAAALIFPDHPGKKEIPLPDPLPDSQVTLAEVLRKRRSVRAFDATPMTLEQLSTLLKQACGVTESRVAEINGKMVTQFFRSYPSGGGLYPIEVYFVACNVEGLEPGLYAYRVFPHTIYALDLGRDLVERTFETCSMHPDTVDLSNSQIIMVLSSVFWRQATKYGLRAYRFALQESGHIAQNVALVATALNLGSLVMGGFYDDELNQLLHLDGVEQAVLYFIPIGRPDTLE